MTAAVVVALLGVLIGAASSYWLFGERVGAWTDARSDLRREAEKERIWGESPRQREVKDRSGSSLREQQPSDP